MGGGEWCMQRHLLLLPTMSSRTSISIRYVYPLVQHQSDIVDQRSTVSHLMITTAVGECVTPLSCSNLSVMPLFVANPTNTPLLVLSVPQSPHGHCPIPLVLTVSCNTRSPHVYLGEKPAHPPPRRETFVIYYEHHATTP